MKRRAPTLGILLLVVGLLWLMKDLGWIKINIPWVPILLILLGAMIIYRKWSF